MPKVESELTVFLLCTLPAAADDDERDTMEGWAGTDALPPATAAKDVVLDVPAAGLAGWPLTKLAFAVTAFAAPD